MAVAAAESCSCCVRLPSWSSHPREEEGLFACLLVRVLCECCLRLAMTEEKALLLGT